MNNSNIDSIEDSTVNPILEEIKEKCYKNLMEVCRGLAESLNISTNAVMTIEVSLKQISFFYIWTKMK